ncbi:MAG: chromate transporter [Frisingicoccus sp.]|nr:chromate transporter [Frisingicoccus sp.]
MNELLKLFMAFARIGAFTFGGGYAMLPMLQKEVVEKNHWATEDEIMDYFAIGQCTPGIIAVNTATFVGYKTKGIPGAIAATLGMITPSIIIITVIAAFLKNFADLPIVKHAFNGIRACVCVLILNAVTKLAQKSIVDKACLGICIVVLLLSLFSPLSPALIIILAGAAGVLFKRTGIAGGEK